MTQLPNILAIDDDANFLQSLQLALRAHYNVVCASSISEALGLLGQRPFQAILLDLELGQEVGTSLLEKLNEEPNRAPVIVISGTLNMHKARELLNLHVFGFLEKPTPLAELLDCLNKATKRSTQSDILRDDEFMVDLHKQVAIYQGKELSLTKIQLEIVALFLSKKGITISRDELIKYIWGEKHISRNVLDTHLFNIKQKLPPFKEGLRLVHGRGYCYEK